MDELFAITEKYDAAYIEKSFRSLEGINQFALVFFTDVAQIYDCLTRIKSIERNPTGFSIDDAPILGLLVRVAKLFKEVIRYYETENAEVIALLERPLIEASVISSYLMVNDNDVILDYRKCSYKDRLRILRDLEGGSAFFDTKAGKRLLGSIREKMEFENLTKEDFSAQKNNRWKLQGKNFYDIFSEVADANLYASTYGMMSESVHGSWNDSLDWCLSKNDDGTFSPNLYSYPADVRFVCPTIHYINKPFHLWLQRIDAYDDNLKNQLDWIERVNRRLFQAFDTLFDE